MVLGVFVKRDFPATPCRFVARIGGEAFARIAWTLLPGIIVTRAAVVLTAVLIGGGAHAAPAEFKPSPNWTCRFKDVPTITVENFRVTNGTDLDGQITDEEIDRLGGLEGRQQWFKSKLENGQTVVLRIDGTKSPAVLVKGAAVEGKCSPGTRMVSAPKPTKPTAYQKTEAKPKPARTPPSLGDKVLDFFKGLAKGQGATPGAAPL